MNSDSTSAAASCLAATFNPRMDFSQGKACQRLHFSLQLDEHTIANFMKSAEEVWNQRQGDSEVMARKLTAQLEDKKRMKSELLRAKLRGEVSQADYAQANSEFDSEIALLTEQLEMARTDGLSLPEFLRFAKLAVGLDLARTWQYAKSEQKQGVQTLVFKNGLHYSQESKKFEHPNRHLFSVVADMSSKNGGLASPTGTSDSASG